MNWRDKLADWISGGELSRLIHDNKSLLRSLSFEVNFGDRCEEALDEIAAQETPSANATVKRMARIAREALE